MWGKTLKISSNDVYGNVDDRRIDVFAAFTHKKYLNKYVIFTFKNDYNKNKLYCGSVHLKSSSIVTFAVNDRELEFINNFVNQYKTGMIDQNEYELINITNIEKAELISYNEEEYQELELLKKVSIPEEINPDNKKVEKKKQDSSVIFLYTLLVILILFLGVTTYLYLNPSVFDLKMLTCTMDSYNEKIELNYQSNTEIKFDRLDELVSIDKIDSYTFKDKESYDDFKNNNKESIYFTNAFSYKYEDESLSLKIIYQDNLIIYKYDEVLNYFKKQGYTCQEGIYNE